MEKENRGNPRVSFLYPKITDYDFNTGRENSDRVQK